MVAFIQPYTVAGKWAMNGPSLSRTAVMQLRKLLVRASLRRGDLELTHTDSRSTINATKVNTSSRYPSSPPALDPSAGPATSPLTAVILGQVASSLCLIRPSTSCSPANWPRSLRNLGQVSIWFRMFCLFFWLCGDGCRPSSHPWTPSDAEPERGD